MDRLADKQTVPWRHVDRPVTTGWTELPTGHKNSHYMSKAGYRTALLKSTGIAMQKTLLQSKFVKRNKSHFRTHVITGLNQDDVIFQFVSHV